MSSYNRGGYREGAGRKPNILAESSRKMRSLRATDKEWEMIKSMEKIVKSDKLEAERMLNRYKDRYKNRHKDSPKLMWLQLLYCSPQAIQPDIQPELEELYQGKRKPPRNAMYRKKAMDKENLSILNSLSDEGYITMSSTEDGMYCLSITEDGIDFLVEDLKFLHRDPTLM